MIYIIRNAVKDDVKSIAIMFHNTVSKVNSKDYTQEQIKAWQDRATPERWAELWNSGLEFIVAEDADKQIVGFASFNKDGYIHSMFVHYLHQGEGIATALLHETEQRLKGLILTSEVSITAKPFFEKMGFRVVKQQSVVLNGVELVNYEMTKLNEPSIHISAFNEK